MSQTADTLKRRDPSRIPALLASQVLAYAPHVAILPAWVSLWCFFFWAYAWAVSEKRWRHPPGGLLLLLTVGGFVLILMTWRRNLDNETYVALLSVMAGLKALEIRTYRDEMIMAFLSYFIVITGLFFSDTLMITLYMAGSVWATTAILIHLHDPGSRWREKARQSLILLLQAAPFMLLLFVIFPRIQMGIGGIPRSTQGSSGFSGSMSPGSLSRMVQNDALAFRVQFDGPVPDYKDLYWRGVVFTHFDGTTWHRAAVYPLNVRDGENREISYSITLEPHREHWLFALDRPATFPDLGLMMNDFTLISRRRVTSRLTYPVASDLFPVRETADRASQKDIFLHLPSGNPRARRLAAEWAASARTPGDVADAAMAYFARNPFSYTLKPPLLEGDRIDDFLFNTRKGFCEHYASAFVFLMRAASVPARVVGGYMGGEMNPYSGYLMVRQTDAHAWTEIWLPEKGWTRVDPTAAVSPDRIARGVTGALSPDDLTEIFGFPDLGYLTDLARRVRMGWDSIESFWTIQVMGYTLYDQKKFLGQFGLKVETLKQAVTAGLLAVLLLGMLTAGVMVRIFRRKSPAEDPVRTAYEVFCRKLSSAGVPKAAGEGPLDYANRVSCLRQDLKQAVSDLTGHYVRLRYGPERPPDDILKFKTAVRRFKTTPGRSY